MNTIKRLIIIPALLVLTLNAYSEDQQAAPKKTTVAVQELTSKGVSGMEASIVSDFLRDSLTNTQAFNLVERSSMEQLLSEQKFQMSGCTSDECAVKMGKMLNVQKMIMGSLSKLGEIYYIGIRMVDVEQGTIILAETVTANSQADLQPACAELATRIATGKKGSYQSASPVTTAAPAAQGEGILDVKNVLDKVTVEVDDISKGVTPLQIKLSAGSHKVKLVKDDKYWENTVTINNNETTTINPKLSIAPGQLDIKTEPTGAQVIIDDSSIGNTPIKQSMSLGSYNIKIIKSGYEPYKDKIYVQSNKTTTLNVLLKTEVIKPKIKNRLGIGFGPGYLSFRWFVGALTWELKAGSEKTEGDGQINMSGGRLYINFNPRSHSIFYMGFESDTIGGKTAIQDIKGTASGAFLGMEVFMTKRFSALFDIGQYKVALTNKDYDIVKSEGNYTVGNAAINFYFVPGN